MKESQIELAICNALARKGLFVVKLKDQCAMIDGSYKRGSSYQLTGVPDLVVYLKKGVTVWVEVKNATGTLSDAQRAYHKKLKSLGHHVIVARSVKETIYFFDQLL